MSVLTVIQWSWPRCSVSESPLPSTCVSHSVGAQAAPESGLSSGQSELIDWIITSSHAAPVPHFSTAPLGPEVNEAGRDHCRSITADRSPSVRGTREGWTRQTVDKKALNVRPAAGSFGPDCTTGVKPYSGECCAGMCSLIRLTSFPLSLSLLLGEQQGQNDGRQRSSMLSSPNSIPLFHISPP